MPVQYNRSHVVWSDLRKQTDLPAEDLKRRLDDAYYGPEDPSGRRSGGWRDGVSRPFDARRKQLRVAATVTDGTRSITLPVPFSCQMVMSIDGEIVNVGIPGTPEGRRAMFHADEGGIILTMNDAVKRGGTAHFFTTLGSGLSVEVLSLLDLIGPPQHYDKRGTLEESRALFSNMSALIDLDLHLERVAENARRPPNQRVSEDSLDPTRNGPGTERYSAEATRRRAVILAEGVEIV